MGKTISAWFSRGTSFYCLWLLQRLAVESSKSCPPRASRYMIRSSRFVIGSSVQPPGAQHLTSRKLSRSVVILYLCAVSYTLPRIPPWAKVHHYYVDWYLWSTASCVRAAIKR